jgi:hypothetical protein
LAHSVRERFVFRENDGVATEGANRRVFVWVLVFYVHLTLLGGHQHFTRSRLMGLAQAAGMEGARLSLLEARVWPWDNVGFQNLVDALQDAAERIGLLDPWLCYHLVRWVRPAGKGRNVEGGVAP